MSLTPFPNRILLFRRLCFYSGTNGSCQDELVQAMAENGCAAPENMV
jgi:hypothetical protein